MKKNIYSFYIYFTMVRWHREKSSTRITYTVNVIASDGLAAQAARASVTMVLTYISQDKTLQWKR